MATDATFSGELSNPANIFEPPLMGAFEIDLSVEDELLDKFIPGAYYAVFWRWVLDLTFLESLPLKVFAGNPNLFQLGHWAIWVGDSVIQTGFLSYIKQASPYYGFIAPQVVQPRYYVPDGVTDPEDKEAVTLPRNLLVESNATKASFLLIPGVEARLNVPYSCTQLGGESSPSF